MIIHSFIPLLFIATHGFVPMTKQGFGHRGLKLHEHLHDRDVPEGIPGDDWRAFRARLVMGERNNNDIAASVNTWAYEQPSIERGSLLVHHPRNPHYGLTDQRQFLYKSVVLIVEIAPHVTVGLVLNRPTHLKLPDDLLNGPIIYGGNECGIHTCHQSQKLYCLHHLSYDDDDDDDDEILSGLFLTNLGEIKSFIDKGIARNKDDFVTFCGFVTWDTMELVDEMEAGEWHSISVDPYTLYQEVISVHQDDGPSLDLWSTFMERINHKEEISETNGSFDDRMLHEWVRAKLDHPQATETLPTRTPLKAGMLLRASSDAFLLEHQSFHKALLLLLQHDEDFTVGILLNHPTVDMTDDELGKLPIRYGGHFDMLDTENKMPPFCLSTLCAMQGGSEMVGQSFWKSSLEQAEAAVHHGSLQPHNFLVVRGLEIWETVGEGSELLKDYQDGKWDIVESTKVSPVWDVLLAQQSLSPLTMETNLDLSHHAWRLAGGVDRRDDGGFMESFPTDLGRDALKLWVSGILMND